MSDKQQAKENFRTPFEDNPCQKMMKWDSLDSVVLALSIIWAGLVFITNNFGIEIETWPLIFLGAGIFILIEIAIRLLVPVFRTSIFGDLILAGILFWLGDWASIWPVFLIITGIFIFWSIINPKGKIFGEKGRSKDGSFIKCKCC